MVSHFTTPSREEGEKGGGGMQKVGKWEGSRQASKGKKKRNKERREAKRRKRAHREANDRERGQARVLMNKNEDLVK